MLIRHKLQATALFTIACHVVGWLLLAGSVSHVIRVFEEQEKRLHTLAALSVSPSAVATAASQVRQPAATAFGDNISPRPAAPAAVRDLRRMGTNLILGLGAALVLITGVIITLTLLVVRSITRPLLTIGRGVETVGAGRLDHQIVLTGNDELAQLADTFNRMTSRLATSTASRDELAREVEQRKRTEETLRETMAQLEASNRELEQFAYAASHDLQEPLRSISGYLSLLENKFSADLGPDAQKYISRPMAAAKRLQELIRGLLLYSRVGTKGKPFAPVTCQELIETLQENLHTMIEESGTVITYSPRPLPVVMADAGQLYQLFQNLVQNAIKFRGQDPPRIHIEGVKQGSGWRFFVRDNGIGFDMTHADRIFLLYQRLHSRREFDGTGIGLAVCKKIVERHHGSISVESRPGHGTTFFFTINT